MERMRAMKGGGKLHGCFIEMNSVQAKQAVPAKDPVAPFRGYKIRPKSVDSILQTQTDRKVRSS